MPPLIGWAAVRNSLGLDAWALYVILFLWQFPHLLAIAWMYREDYARAGLQMLPRNDREGRTTVRQILGYSLVLIPASLMPVFLGQVGKAYLVGALVLGLGFLALWHAPGPTPVEFICAALGPCLSRLLASGIRLADGGQDSVEHREIRRSGEQRTSRGSVLCSPDPPDRRLPDRPISRFVSELCLQLLNDRIQPVEEGLFSLFAIPGVFERGDAFTLFVQGDKVARDVLVLVLFRHPFPEKALVAGMPLDRFVEI